MYGHDAAGKIVSAFMRLREGKAVGSIQPNPKYLVFFELGSDQRPVAITLLEPVPGFALSRYVSELHLDADGSPTGMSGKMEHDFVSVDEMVESTERLRVVVDALTNAIKELAGGGQERRAPQMQ